MVVHVPFFNIEIPEPHIEPLLMNGCQFILSMLSRVLDLGAVALQTGPTPAQQELIHLRAGGWGREVDDLQRRFDEGQINDEQLSSECNDASFAYYRRQLRTGIIGATEEMTDDLIRRKMGLNVPGAQQDAIADFFEHSANPALRRQLADDLQITDTEELQEVLLNSLHAEEQEMIYQQQDAADRTEGISMLQRGVRGQRRHATQVVRSGSLGLGVGLIACKAVAMVTYRLFKKKKSKQQPKGRAASTFTAAARPVAAAASQPSATTRSSIDRSQSSSHASSSQTAAAAKAQVAAAATEAAAAVAAAAAAVPTRTRPTTKRR